MVPGSGTNGVSLGLSSSPREAPLMTGPRVFPLLIVLLLGIASPLTASPAGTTVPLSEMARLEAEEHLDASGASFLVDGYLSFGLGREAASSVGRRIRLGELPRDAAASLFERVVADRSVREDPAQSLLSSVSSAEKEGSP